MLSPEDWFIHETLCSDLVVELNLILLFVNYSLKMVSDMLFVLYGEQNTDEGLIKIEIYLLSSSA